MHITIDRKELLAGLALPTATAEKKSTIPILANLRMEATGDTLLITGTDLELSASVTVAARIKEGGVVTLPAKRLHDYIRALPNGEVTIAAGANHWATITCGRSKTRISGLSPDSFPEIPAKAPDAMIRLSCAALHRMIRTTEFCISREETRFTLAGALLEVSDGIAKMVTTDGHRMALMEGAVSTDGPKPPNSLIPLRAMQSLKNLDGDGEIAISADDNHLFFSQGNVLIVARKMTGNFPDYRRAMSNGASRTNTLTVAKADIETGLKRVIQFSDEKSRAVRFTFDAETMKISAETAHSGESEESMPANGAMAGAIEIGLNGQYVLDLLGAIEEDQVTFRLKGATESVFVSHGSGGQCVIMSMRI